MTASDSCQGMSQGQISRSWYAALPSLHLLTFNWRQASIILIPELRIRRSIRLRTHSAAVSFSRCVGGLLKATLLTLLVLPSPQQIAQIYLPDITTTLDICA